MGGYRIHVTSADGVLLGDNVSYIESQGIVKDCCVSETYKLWLNVDLPAGGFYFLIAPWSEYWGTSPAGTFLSIPLSITPPPTTPPPKLSNSVTTSFVGVVIASLLIGIML